jgi:RNA polymerase sigma-70 factor (ECF subfamily)
MQYTSAKTLFFPVSSQVTQNKQPSTDEVEPSEESRWLSSVADGEKQAMGLLVGKWQEPLYRFFYRSLGNHADAEDLTQKTFIRTYKAASRYRPTAKFSSWIFTIARNLLIDEIKRKQKAQTIEFQEELTSMTSLSLDGKSVVDEWKEIFQHVLQGTPEKQRTALLLRVQQEWTYLEIANLMEVSEQVVKTWIHRARQKLKNKLKILEKKGEL